MSLELVIWEELSAQMQLTRSQDAYNREIGKCQFFVLLASGRIGKYTQEEYQTAYRLFQNIGKLRLLVYLQKGSKEEKSLSDFKNTLNEIEYFPAAYAEFNDLWTQLNQELETHLHKIWERMDTREKNDTFDKQIGNIPINPKLLIGREGKLSSIYQAFFEESKPVLLLAGQGGLGKTTIASKYYHSYHEDYSHLIWIINEKKLDDSLLSLSMPMQLKLDSKATKPQQINHIIQTINTLDKPVLMVIDNVDDYDDLFNNHSYLNKSPNIHILITTRLTSFEEFDKLNIKQLSQKKAQELFIYYYDKYSPETEQKLLQKILKSIVYNTLVIELLAKNLKQTKLLNYGLKELLNDLQKQGILQISKQRKVSHNYHELQAATPKDIIQAMYNMADLSSDELQTLTLFSVLPEISLSMEDAIAFSALEEEKLADTLLDLANKAWLEID